MNTKIDETPATSSVPESARTAPSEASVEAFVEAQEKQSSQPVGEYVIATRELFTSPGYRAHVAGDHVPVGNAKRFGWDKEGATKPV